jgi:hypothetical protein
MAQHVIFVAPFIMEATLRFIAGATYMEGVNLSIISQEPSTSIPADIRARLAGHWQVSDALDPQQIVAAAEHLQKSLGKANCLFGPLEQLQVPLAIAREQMGLDGLSVAASLNFRDKSRMKTVLTQAGVPCARHALIGDPASAAAFAQKVGFPMVVKPVAGAGGKSTFRLNHAADLDGFLKRFPPNPASPSLFEEFVQGREYSFDSVMLNGKLVWHSISCYLPSPLEVMENPWIQWIVMLPRDIDGPEFDPIRDAATSGLKALGLNTGLSHMEWFRLKDDRIALSEVGARPPGAQITSLLSYAHDIDFYKAWPRLMALGEFEPPPRRYAAGAAYIRGMGIGRVKHVYGLDEAQRRFGSIVVEAKIPRQGQSPADSYEGDGYVIVRHPDSSVVEHALQEIVKLVRVELG